MTQQTHWLLMTMAFFLGIRHGFDLDHLATIDAMTRMVRSNRLLSKMVGFLFSLGHGMVVIVISLCVGNELTATHIPEWLNGVGDTISLIFLFVFGVLTLWNVLKHSSTSALPTSLQHYLAQKFIKQNIRPLSVVSIGMLFAFSFDTVSQVVLFSLAAKAMAGLLFSGLLGIMFMLGMMIADGLNGLLVSMLIQRADTMSLFLSRMTGLFIACFSLIIGIINSIKLFHS